MKIRVTSVTWSESLPLMSDLTLKLEKKLIQFFKDKSYGGGIDQFTAVIVAVDANGTGNEKFCKTHDKVSSYKDMFTENKIKLISIGLPFDPDFLEKMNEDELRIAICDAIINRLSNIGLKRIPKDFEYDKFANDLSLALEIIKRSVIG